MKQIIYHLQLILQLPDISIAIHENDTRASPDNFFDKKLRRLKYIK